MAAHRSDGHQPGPVHPPEPEWARRVAHLELEGEVLLGFVTDSARWIAELRGRAAPPVRRVLDIGSGPGVGTCELARLFPAAALVAVDGAPAMLDAAARRAAAHGLEGRITTHLAELPHGLGDLGPVGVIWASMSLHHTHDATSALRGLRDLLEPSGALALAEFGEPTRVLPDNVDVGGRPGLAVRLARAESTWIAATRLGASGNGPSTSLASLLTAARFQTIGSRLAHVSFDPPLSDDARLLAARQLRRARHQFDELLDDDDLRALDVLCESDDLRSVFRRPDVFFSVSRRIVVARPQQPT